MVVLLVVTMVATLLGPVGVTPAAAQDDLSIPTRVVVLHADPAVKELKVFIDDVKVLEDFAYGAQSDWIEFTPDSTQVTITADRIGFNYVFFDAVYPAPAGYDYSLIVTETLVMGDVFDTTPVPEGTARLRIVHASSALPAVEVTASGTNWDFATELAYSQTSDDVIVPVGGYDFTVTLADDEHVVLTASGVILADDMTYDLVLLGQPGDENHPLELRSLVDTTREDGTPTP